MNVSEDMSLRLWGKNGWASTSGANKSYAGAVYLYYVSAVELAYGGQYLS